MLFLCFFLCFFCVVSPFYLFLFVFFLLLCFCVVGYSAFIPGFRALTDLVIALLFVVSSYVRCNRAFRFSSTLRFSSGLLFVCFMSMGLVLASLLVILLLRVMFSIRLLVAVVCVFVFVSFCVSYGFFFVNDASITDFSPRFLHDSFPFLPPRT